MEFPASAPEVRARCSASVISILKNNFRIFSRRSGDSRRRLDSECCCESQTRGPDRAFMRRSNVTNPGPVIFGACCQTRDPETIFENRYSCQRGNYNEGAMDLMLWWITSGGRTVCSAPLESRRQRQEHKASCALPPARPSVSPATSSRRGANEVPANKQRYQRNERANAPCSDHRSGDAFV